MITKQDNFTSVVRGGAKAQSFTIDTESSVIFEILRDKMYKDKLGAVAREVSSNSRDANREAGTDKPAEIKIIKPNRLQGIGHESISFKDYGSGMNPDKIQNIYLKYGASDKRTTNVFTGGFGLGAKTPFAYNDTFTVITVAEWEKPIYETRTKEVPVLDEDGEPLTDDLGMQITEEVEYEEIVGYLPSRRYKWKHTGMLDTSGKGEMVTFSEEETDEPTGTEVIVPIKTLSDRMEFERKVLKYTKYWGDEVTYINFSYEPEVLETIFEEENFVLYHRDNYTFNLKVELLIDGIPYPIDNDILKLNDTIGSQNKYFLTVLKFQTGELTISANRESVQYDEETVALIKERFAAYQEFLDEKVSMLVEGKDTYLKACIQTYYIKRHGSNKVNPTNTVKAVLAHAKGSGNKLKNPTWRGIHTVDNVIFKHHTVYYVTLKGDRNTYDVQDSIEIYENLTKKKIVYGDTRKSSLRNARIWDEGDQGFYLITPKDKNSKAGIEEFMNFIFKLDLDFQLYSDIEPVKTVAGAKGVYVKKDYVTLNIRTVNDYYSLNKNSIQVERKTFESSNGEDYSKYVYDTVDKLAYSDWKADTKKLRFLRDRGYTSIVVRKQDAENWFEKTDMKYYKDIYDAEYDKWLDELINQKKDQALNQMILEIRDEFIQRDHASLIDANLPKIVRGREQIKPTLSDKELEIVKKKLKFDFEGLKKKLNSIFVERYPLIKAIENSHYIKERNRKQQLELYIKQVNNYYGN